MRGPVLLFLPSLVVLVAGTRAAETPAQEPLATVAGKTQPAPGRVVTIAPLVLEPVTEVLVRAGDHVKKDQPIVRFAAHEAEAAVAARVAGLEQAQAALKQFAAQPRHHEIDEARAQLQKATIKRKDVEDDVAKFKPLIERGAMPAKRLDDAETALAEAKKVEQGARDRLAVLQKRPIDLQALELDEKSRVAAAELAAARAQLAKHTLVARIDGVVTRLDANPGMIARPGTAAWGEILDPGELDVRAEVTPELAARISAGTPAAVLAAEQDTELARGTVTSVSIAANPATGQVPAIVHIKNPENRLRCYIPVRVRFLAGGNVARRPAR